MKVYELSSVGKASKIGIHGITLETREQLKFMNPDDGPNPAPTARQVAADQWPGLQVVAKREHDKKAKPYFLDVVGPGFVVPGCEIAVSDHARKILEPILEEQVRFLSLDIVGAPCQYWALYVTQYYFGELDQELSRFDEPYSSAKDRRKMLRAPAFKQSAILDDLYIFRLPGTLDYVVSDCSYATEKFYELAKLHNLGGFSFLNIYYKGFKADPLVGPVLVTSGTKYPVDLD
ncbi:hypothetical protein ACO0LL_04470 [Undibacterium sp. TC4M20W]|uniref:hypothetical protein n=1 Tax=Undibacterium sp. TC4M20W TaxID=3413052 RepID=UPI003BEF5CC1